MTNIPCTTEHVDNLCYIVYLNKEVAYFTE